MHGCIRSNAVKERCVLTIQEQKGVTSSGVFLSQSTRCLNHCICLTLSWLPQDKG